MSGRKECNQEKWLWMLRETLKGPPKVKRGRKQNVGAIETLKYYLAFKRKAI